MNDIVITIASFIQGYCLGSVLTLILCVLVVAGLMRLSRKQQKEAVDLVRKGTVKK